MPESKKGKRMRKWIVLLIAAVVVYFLWRKFGGQIKTAITSVTK